MWLIAVVLWTLPTEPRPTLRDVEAFWSAESENNRHAMVFQQKGIYFLYAKGRWVPLPDQAAWLGKTKRYNPGPTEQRENSNE